MRFVKQWTRVPLLLGVLTLSVWPPSAFAQVTTADVVGTVSDSSGGLLPGVTITARNDATGNTETVVTDAEGNFQILRLAPGRYRVTTALQGFKTVDSEVTLAIGDRFRLGLKLEIGSVEEHLTVTGQAPLLQTETTSVAVLVDERAMQDLPLNGRNFIRLAQLTPGATEGPANALSSGNRPDDRRQSSAIAVNGQDTSQNNFLIDGLDNNERFIGTVIIRPQVDSIREMRIETSSFSAELGRHGWRHHQRRHQERHERHARVGVRVLPERNDGLEELLRQIDPQAALRPEPVRRQLWRPDLQGQNVLLRRLRWPPAETGRDPHLDGAEHGASNRQLRRPQHDL